MRPVRLDLNGFAAFREPATVDFTDADYFALVGATGSGKSTVIDAMTFALYGSAPRWGSSSSIQYALAPTANRCTVRLLFDVSGRRYVVAREVRRSGQQVSQRSCVLERFLDPTATGDPDAVEDTESLAADPKSVRQQVIELLGLEFDDFCTCVVLPQGEFATFLQASPTERQSILLKLIGARIYDAIGKVAGRRADEARVRAEAWKAQLGELGDATQETEDAARDRERRLAGLETEVDRAVTGIRDLAAARTRTAEALAAAEAEVSLLDGVSPPGDVGRLQADIDGAQVAYQLAVLAVRDATAAATEADRAVANGPNRAWVDETLRWHGEVADGTARLATVRVAEHQASEALAAAQLAADTSTELAARHRTAEQVAHQTGSAAAERVDGVRRQLTELRAVELPADLEATSTGLAAASAARDAARTGLLDAERELAQARQVRESLPDRGTLDRTWQALTDYEIVDQSASDLAETAGRADTVAAAAQATLAARRSDLSEAQDAWEDVWTRSVASDLRPHLHVGAACPICDQPVTTLPPPVAVPALDEATARRTAAEQAAGQAEQDWHRLTAKARDCAGRARHAAERRQELDGQLIALLPDRPAGTERVVAEDRAEIERVDGIATAATERANAGAKSVEAARAADRSADEALEQLSDQARASWAQLNGLTGRLAPVGSPAVTTANLGAAWRQLRDWASSEANRISLGLLPELEASSATAAGALGEARQLLEAALTAERAARAEVTVVTADHYGARQERDRLEGQLAELGRRLADRPSTAGAQAQLIECGLLESTAAQARATRDAAAERRDGAEGDRDRLAAARDAARDELHRTRDPLVRLGAPSVDDRDLACAWSDLGAWARSQASARRDDLDGLRDELVTGRRTLADALAELLGRLAAQDVELPGPEPSTEDPELGTRVADASTAVRVERERARSATEAIVRRRESAASLQRKITEDSEIQQVSAELQRLMRSQKFPQWLSNAALDTLVSDASASLLRLSNNQFELTHERGEFFVIDHADADSLRSVRTLSGGETFQASLALALALSEQLSTLAAGGRTTLDSIFLDEGFGTLDPDALEIVAGTLENLAQEDRMVGVITHVTALADRIPVRYEVTRDSRTSTIERMGA